MSKKKPTNRAANRRATPSRKAQERAETEAQRNAMLRLLMHAVDKAGGTLIVTVEDHAAMPFNAELRSTTRSEDGAQVLTLVKPAPRDIEVKYASGPPGSTLPPGLQAAIDSVKETERAASPPPAAALAARPIRTRC